MKRDEGEKLGGFGWVWGILTGLCFMLLNPFGLAFILAVGFVCLFFVHLK